MLFFIDLLKNKRFIEMLY